MKTPHLTATPIAALAAVVMSLSLSGPATAMVPPGTPAPTRPVAAPAPARPVASASAVRVRIHPTVRPQRRVAAALAIHIPRLRLNKTMVRLHVQRNRTFTVPRRFSDVGWWSEGPRPAAPGAMIVGAHISSRSAPGAFLNLRTMRRGDLLTVDRADGTTAIFQVRGKASYSRRNFPSRQIYRTAGRASIYLITCDGAFSPRIGHHVNNLVVFADLVGAHRTRRRA